MNECTRVAQPVVLFVCTGNVCRSPMAAALFRAAASSGSLNCRVWSAGTCAADGWPASPAAVSVLRESGLDLSLHRSRALTAQTIDASSVIVVMTPEHRDVLVAEHPDAGWKICLLRSFDPAAESDRVEDPIGMSESVYRRIRDQIAAAMPGLVGYVAALARRDGDRRRPASGRGMR